jgi:hypothetical protein
MSDLLKSLAGSLENLAGSLDLFAPEPSARSRPSPVSPAPPTPVAQTAVSSPAVPAMTSPAVPATTNPFIQAVPSSTAQPTVDSAAESSPPPAPIVTPLSEFTFAVRPVAPQAPISLDDFVSRDVRIEWDEAVAVVEELCALVTAGNAERTIPDLAGIFITASGEVALSKGGEHGPSAVGRTLHALLSSSANVPVPLRLFVTQSTAPETYASVREFAAALAYFAKPGRAELIRSLHQRGAASIVLSPQAAEHRRRTPEQPEPAAPKRTPSPNSQKARTWTLAVVAGASVMAVFAVGVWLWLTAKPGQAAPTLPALVSSAKSVVQSIGTEVRQTLGIGGPIVREKMELDDPPAPNVPPNRSARKPPAAASAAAPAGERSPQTLPLTGDLASFVLLEDISPTRDVHLDVLPDEAASAEVIYTSDDASVRPPTLVYPQLFAPTLANPPSSSLNTMEVVVSERGTVERVRLLDGPRRMSDIMLLSGAKAWRFQPAMKGDTPVRFRTVLRWNSVP